MSFVKGLECRECGQDYPKEPLHVCETCFGPLEIVYDYDAIAKAISREKIAGRDKNLWRYRELLPIDEEPRVGMYSGFTPLVKADRLAEALGVKELYIKDDSVNHPTFSYKDRVVSVAISKAIEFGSIRFRAPRPVILRTLSPLTPPKPGSIAMFLFPTDWNREKLSAQPFMGQKRSPSKGTMMTLTGSAAKSAISMVGRSST